MAALLPGQPARLDEVMRCKPPGAIDLAGLTDLGILLTRLRTRPESQLLGSHIGGFDDW